MKTGRKIASTGAVLILGFVLAACNMGLAIDDGDTGSVIISIGGNANTFSTKAISVTVTCLAVVLTSESYPTLRASATYVDTGTSVSFSNVKAGTWAIQVYLDDASGNTQHYGEGTVLVVPGSTANAAVTVFETGGIVVGITEGIIAPSFEVSNANYTDLDMDVSITIPAFLTGAQIKYTTDDTDPVLQGGSFASPVDLPGLGFGVTVRAVTYIAGESLHSDESVFAYGLPFFSLAAGGPYLGFQQSTIYSMVPGATIRYTLDGSDPTAEYGTLAGNGSTALLADTTVFLKAVSYIAGQPETVSEIATATYDLTLESDISVAEGGVIVYTNGANTYDFGGLAPEALSGAMAFEVSNPTTADLSLEITGVTLGGTNPEHFSIDAAMLDTTIPVDGVSAFDVYFTPSALGSFSAIVSIASNDPDENPFTFEVTGEGNTPPTITFLEGLLVEDASTTAMNGYYEAMGTNLSGNEYYKKLGAAYYVFFDWDYSTYLIGAYFEYDPSSPITLYYGKYPSGYNLFPTGESYEIEGDSSANAWTGSGYTGTTAPYVSYVTDGIAGWRDVGRDLSVWFDYDDTELDPSGSHLYQWYRGNGSTDSWTAIDGETNPTYLMSGTYSRQDVTVEVTPIASSGATQGDPVSSGYVLLP